MELQRYKLIVESRLYVAHYIIRAGSLQDAIKQARVKFAQSYKVFGKDVKIKLNPDDLKNHIEEIMQNLYAAK